MRFRVRHPSRRRLENWLESGDEGLETHLADCDRCANRIESLARGESAPLAAALDAVLAPPADFDPVLRRGIAKKLQARDDLVLLGEMLGVSWRTVRIMSQGPKLHE